ncbi:SAM-dependent methyltransferase [Lawsonia intracellularis]|uniref:class I SAM-dependent methyltransferase n=1 Tax=Lawsonia intracellularis TaxID=29546 RepID=UPI00097632EE|nr:class I SAM-dependent methyltransferase [Lawsonia intracellularis]OMQ02037.1 SAM-dependent methyltransferase [Lawsonia intracellularis]
MKNIDIQSDDTKKYEYIIHTKNYKKNILLTKYNQIIEYIDSNFTVTSNMSFLEIGFNDGLLFKSLQKKYPKAKFIGVEVRQSCVDNMVKQGFDCRLITNELFPIDEKFDVIYGASVLHHISKPFDFIKHLFKLSKRNIQLTLQALTKHYQITYDSPVFLNGFKTINTVYRKMKLDKLPIINTISFMAKR